VKKGENSSPAIGVLETRGGKEQAEDAVKECRRAHNSTFGTMGRYLFCPLCCISGSKKLKRPKISLTRFREEDPPKPGQRTAKGVRAGGWGQERGGPDSAGKGKKKVDKGGADPYGEKGGEVKRQKIKRRHLQKERLGSK